MPIKSIKISLIIVLILMSLVLAAVVVLILIQSESNVSLAVFCIGGLTILLAVWSMTIAASRRSGVGAVLNYVEQTVRLNLPLPRMIQAIALSQRGQLRRELQATEQSLQRGEPLGVALRSLPQLPPRVLNLLVQAEQVGRLPQVLARLMEQRRSAMSRREDVYSFYRTYIPIVCIVLIIVTLLFVKFVLPSFVRIFNDLHVALPWTTMVVMNIAKRCGPWLAAAVVLFSVLWIASIVARQRGTKFGLTESASDWLLNRLPGFARIRTYNALSDVLAFAAETIDAGQTLDGALMTAAQIPANSKVRGKVSRWADAMSRGQLPAEAARTANLPSLLSGMLETAVDTPGVAEVLRFLSRYYASRFSRAVILLRAAAIPAFAIVMGCLTALLALGVFLPLVRLIDTVGPYKWSS